jgi:hypothetical protein
MNEAACETIRNAVIEAQMALAAYIELGGPDASTTISAVIKALDTPELLRALRETADQLPNLDAPQAVGAGL